MTGPYYSTIGREKDLIAQYESSVTETPHNGGTLPNARMVPSTSSSDSLSKFLQKLISDIDGLAKQPTTVVLQQPQPSPSQPSGGIAWNWNAVIKGALIGVAVVAISRMLR